MRISWERLIPSFLIFCISFLAARYLGTVYYVFYRAFFLLIVMDLVFLVVSYFGARYNQHFSAEHLTRGEKITYDFYLYQSFPTFANHIKIRFYPFNSPEMTDLSPVDFHLRSRRKKSFNYAIQGGTRGIYRVGIKTLEMEDFMGFMSLRLTRHERTFYIYPRLYRGTGYPLKEVKGGGETILEKSHGERDNTFSNLKEYRPGLSLRTISWKHFARYGFPVIKEQENSVRPGRVIYMDRRSLGNQRQREDGVLESTLALISRILSSGEAVILEGLIPGKSLEITGEAAFEALYQSTLSLDFDDPHSPSVRDGGEAVTLITALPDWTLLEESFWLSRSQWQMAAVLEGMEETRKEKVQITLEDLQRKGVDITIIDRGETFWQEK